MEVWFYWEVLKEEMIVFFRGESNSKQLDDACWHVWGQNQGRKNGWWELYKHCFHWSGKGQDACHSCYEYLAFFLIWKLCVILISQKYISLFIRHISSRACVDFSYFLIALYNKIFVLWYNALMYNFPFILLVSHSERWISWFLYLADVVFITSPKSGYVRGWTIHRY